MAENTAVPKSLIEQITDELINRLEDKDGFDWNLIKNISELAANRELKKRAKLMAILKTEGGENETS
jgi:hypothetical protein